MSCNRKVSHVLLVPRSLLTTVMTLVALVAALLVADVATVSVPSRGADARADVPSSDGPPGWWNGDCDTNHWTAQARSVGWTGAAAYRLGASYLGIPACGPRTLDGAPDVWWARSGWGELEWECVEYAMRFMAQVYGVSPYQANGVDVVRNYSASVGGGLVTVANGTPGRAPLPGDVVSFSSPTNSFGHVAVVASSTVDGNGNGSVTMVSQNDTVNGWRTLAVSNWVLAPFGSLSPYGWLHDPLGRGGSGLTDGAFVAHAGMVYRIAGGAPVYVSSWAPFGGPQPYSTPTDAQWSGLALTPRDGSYVRDVGSGKVYRMAGGAPLYLYSCAGAAFTGCSAFVNVDPAALAAAGGPAPWNHLRATPTDGTFLRIGDTGAAYGIIGRVAGGGLLRLYDCTPLGGCNGTVDVNQATYVSYGAAHPLPADATVVRGLPSGTYSAFTGGVCRTVPPGSPGTATAVAVNDASVSCRGPLSIPAAPYHPFVLGSPGTATLTATNGVGALHWSVIAGTVPAGLTLSPAGVLAGTPTVTGTQSLTVQVTDSGTPPATVSGPVVVTVAPAPSVVTTQLSPAVVTTPYDATLSGAGGITPYTWTLTAGSLPAGLTLSASGRLTGTPTTVQDSAFTVTLTDASRPGITASVRLALTVGPAGSVAVGPGG